jgi:hypothetical protein
VMLFTCSFTFTIPMTRWTCIWSITADWIGKLWTAYRTWLGVSISTACYSYTHSNICNKQRLETSCCISLPILQPTNNDIMFRHWTRLLFSYLVTRPVLSILAT